MRCKLRIVKSYLRARRIRDHFPALNDGSVPNGSVVVSAAAADAVIGVAGAGASDGVAANNLPFLT